MNSYYVKCKKDTENIDPKMFRTKNNRVIMQSKCLIKNPLCLINLVEVVWLMKQISN